jgi:hypothetical protein
LILNQPAGEAADDGLDACLMADARALRCQVFEIGVERGDGELVGLKATGVTGALSNPGGELAEDPPIGIEGAGCFGLERREIGSDKILSRLRAGSQRHPPP